MRSPDHREGGDRGFLASCRIPAVLAVAVSAASTGATTGECGDPPVNSMHEGGQSHLGCASHSRRTAAARVRQFRAHGVALSSQPKRLSGLRAERSAGWPFPAAFDFFTAASLTFRTLYYFFVNRAWSPPDPTLQRLGASGQRVDGTSSQPPNLFLDECIGEIIELGQPRPRLISRLTNRAESHTYPVCIYIMECPITEVVSFL